LLHSTEGPGADRLFNIHAMQGTGSPGRAHG
jgi:hypothetical protein